MPLTGKLRSWNDDRGFGFIAPSHGGGELFVHVSAFHKDGSRPVAGELLTYELGRGKDGKPQAIRVFRQTIGHPSSHPSARAHRSTRRRSVAPAVIVLAVVAAIGAFGCSKYGRYATRQLAAPAAAPAEPGATEPGRFRCDGRTHCPQMTSCAESKFFLANCPGVKMDGNNDGVPCEQQWCTSPLAK